MTLINKTKMFGHNCHITGYQGGTPYLKAEKGVIDGIGRQHIYLYFICDKCGKKNTVAHIHGDVNGRIV